MNTAFEINHGVWRWLRCPLGLAVVVRLYSAVANACLTQDDHAVKETP
jgi:hypothetical protein